MGVRISKRSSDTASLSDVPLHILRSELARRAAIAAQNDGSSAEEDAPTCGSQQRGAYNMPIHVFALFLILALSTLACSFPILARRFPGLPIPRRFLFVSRHFGTGVLIATAFVHLLPTAFNSLTNPCLPRFWNETYPAMAGFVAMVSVFVVVLVEMFFAMKGARHVHGSEYDELIRDIGSSRAAEDDEDRGTDYLQMTSHRHRHQQPEEAERALLHSPSVVSDLNSPSQATADNTTPARRRSKSSLDKDGSDSDLDLEELEPYADDEGGDNNNNLRPPSSRPPPIRIHNHHNHHHHQHKRSLSISAPPLSNPQRQLLQCLLLEAGILFHSVFIGMALSVATGTSFVVLLVAISFHQTFEGFALGSRIAALIPQLFPASSPKPWLMALAYGSTTPLGQALGLFLHNLYDPNSVAGLLMVGFTNAISSGLLLFAGLVELLAEDFLSDASYESLRGKRRVEACLSVACGAMLMAFVGAFA
ncbi:hypothetical protein VTN31DRAFT_3696 [Thermomyces dupontii]|uniref:uncharacterized protein n=1 Tax=Talaromyces thermophilus TaxID=28565 RepID=UPI003743236A